MDNTSDEIKGGFEYNTGRRALKLPEYGRNVQKMVAYLKTIEDRDKRNEQARAVVKVMELLNPQVHLQDNYEQKLWDHLQIIADFELDVDSPYPKPEKESMDTRPEPIPLEKRSMKSSHYGKSTASLIELISGVEVPDQGISAPQSRGLYEDAVPQLEQGHRQRRNHIRRHRTNVRRSPDRSRRYADRPRAGL